MHSRDPKTDLLLAAVLWRLAVDPEAPEPILVQPDRSQAQQLFDRTKEAIQDGRIQLGVDLSESPDRTVLMQMREGRWHLLGDVRAFSVSLVPDPLPPYGRIRVLPSSSPTDSPRPTSSSDG